MYHDDQLCLDFQAEMELLMADDEDDEHKHFNYDKIVEHQNLSKKKRKKLLKSDTPLENDDFKVRVSGEKRFVFCVHVCDSLNQSFESIL